MSKNEWITLIIRWDYLTICDHNITSRAEMSYLSNVFLIGSYIEPISSLTTGQSGWAARYDDINKLDKNKEKKK